MNGARERHLCPIACQQVHTHGSEGNQLQPGAIACGKRALALMANSLGKEGISPSTFRTHGLPELEASVPRKAGKARISCWVLAGVSEAQS